MSFLRVSPLALLACLLVSAPSIAQEDGPPPLPGAYGEGVAALRAKDFPAALSAFERCITTQPEHAISCRWERGWVHWMNGNWSAVVADWEAVRAVDPKRDGLERYLSQAKDNLALDAILARGRETAPKTFQSAAAPGTTLRLRAVGDLMISSDFPEGSINPNIDATFSDVGDWLRDADVTFGNLEGPVCDQGVSTKCKPDQAPGSCYAFRTPSKYAGLYKAAGFDVVSTANNHAEDFGPECRAETESHLDRLGIAHSGRPGDIATLTVNNLKIAVVGFHTSRNSHYVNDHEQAALLVKALDRDHDLVIVSFHGGAEGSKAIHVPEGEESFYSENRGNLRVFTHTVIDAGADLVIGHGPHVLRGMEVYKDRLIAYSMGNFATWGRFSLGGNLGIGAVLEVVMDKQGKFVSGKVLPTKQISEGMPVKDPDGKAIDLVRTLSAEDFPNTGVQVAQDGTLARR